MIPDKDRYYWVQVICTGELCPARPQLVAAGTPRVASWSVMGVTFSPEEVEVVAEIPYPRFT